MTTEAEPLRGVPVLVTGASGFTGRVVTRQLVEAGARVRAIARASSDLSFAANLPVEWVRGPVYDPGVVAEAVRGARHVFHVAAAYREPGIRDEMYRLVHVESTRRLAEAAAAEPGFGRFVHVSTVGVHGHIEHPPANEDAPFRPGDIYQETKAEAETWLHAHAPALGLRHAVIRPAAIYGPGDRRLLKLFRLALKPVFPILGFGKCLYHLIHVEDLAAAILLAATHPAAEGRAFIAGNPGPMTLEDIGRTVAAALGRPRLRVLRLPAWPFFAAAALCEAVCRPLGIDPPLYRRRVAFFTKDRAFDTTRLRAELGFHYRFGNADGLAQTALWYREHGWL